jgi:hypothetical protein
VAVRQIVLRLAHRKLGVGVNDRGAAFCFRQHDRVRLCWCNRIEVGVDQPGLQAVDPHHEVGSCRIRHRLFDKRRGGLARARLAVERD